MRRFKELNKQTNKQNKTKITRAVPYIRRSVTGLSPGRPRFRLHLVHVGFVVDNVAMRQVFSDYFTSPLSISSHQCSIFI